MGEYGMLDFGKWGEIHQFQQYWSDLVPTPRGGYAVPGRCHLLGVLVAAAVPGIAVQPHFPVGFPMGCPPGAAAGRNGVRDRPRQLKSRAVARPHKAPLPDLRTGCPMNTDLSLLGANPENPGDCSRHEILMGIPGQYNIY